MKDVYAALLLHSAGQKVTEDSVSKVLAAAGIKEDATKVKALCIALEGVNIDEAVKQAAVVAAPAAAAGEKKEAAPDEKSEAQKEEEASAGLAALFG
ncbi:50S ribosomal protein P1 [Candidatus Micrarchaeota archaeon CG10_big_fil_rev_8_21_14_0_10_59_7]|nr:MAG: 50S ribosomal protein P1 [Candidatus Micrarchaeota archaeon CG10_big_fil_rev_8_21_14_0_10_59_7]